LLNAFDFKNHITSYFSYPFIRIYLPVFLRRHYHSSLLNCLFRSPMEYGNTNWIRSDSGLLHYFCNSLNYEK
ncbi:MAG: hypothetical protein ABL872_06995, partial [Lacibacter sp.]